MLPNLSHMDILKMKNSFLNSNSSNAGTNKAVNLQKQLK